MKLRFIILIIILVNFDVFANEGIKKYMLLNNKNYPYNVSVDINKVGLESDTNDIMLERILKYQQKNILIPFFEKLNSISNLKYFLEFKNMPNVIAFSIDSINTLWLIKETPNRIYFRIGITFYLDKSPGKYAQYNEEYKFWQYFNIAIYSVNDPRYLVNYKYLGFLFNLQ
jgi:hypothetical protein